VTGPAAPELITFGCRLNAAESDTMRRLAAAAGLRDIIIVNTCAVTAEAERQARQAIRRARRDNPGTAIVVTGCAAQIDPTAYAALNAADYIIGNAEKLQPTTWMALASRTDRPRVQVGDILRNAPAPRAAVSEQRSRAFIEVQQGCDHRCTFCVIPYGRGNSRSAAPTEIVARMRDLVRSGVTEIVLTGVDLVSWGRDLPGAPSFAALLTELLRAVPELPRLRLSSLDPVAIDDSFIRLFATERRLMPHIHLSLQAGDDLILKRMKRRHSRAQALNAVARLRAARPEASFGADLIAGFPTEDEAMFGRTLDLIAEAELDFVHAFPFSARPGTPAARMLTLPPATVQTRAAALREAGVRAQAAFLARQVGGTAMVVVERSGRRGLAENFAPVILDHSAAPGALVAVTITGVTGDALLGSVVRAAAA
jgi:threonylcarbamoyladenosine tRNA methylthiotransferase MtaB